MELSIELALLVGQGLGIVGWIWWLLRENTKKIDKLTVDLAKLETLSTTVRADHDSLIMLSKKIDDVERDVNAAHQNIRSLNN